MRGPHRRPLDDALDLRVRVLPRGSRSEIQGVVDGCLRIKTTAPPTDGNANKEVARQLAQAFGVPASRVLLMRGKTGREKLFRIVAPRKAPDFMLETGPR